MKTEYVVGFLFTADWRHVVLIQKNKPVWQAGRYNGVGGKRKPGEDWNACMSRECQEETGVTIPPDAWEHTVTLYNDWFECRFFRACSDQAMQAKTMETEQVTVVSMADVYKLPLITNLHWLLPLSLDEGVHFPIEKIKDGKPNG